MGSIPISSTLFSLVRGLLQIDTIDRGVTGSQVIHRLSDSDRTCEMLVSHCETGTYSPSAGGPDGAGIAGTGAIRFVLQWRRPPAAVTVPRGRVETCRHDAIAIDRLKSGRQRMAAEANHGAASIQREVWCDGERGPT